MTRTGVLAVFDVCDTLYEANTTVGFLRHLAKESPRVERALRRWTGRHSLSFCVGAVAHRIFGKDLARSRLVAELRGERREKLQKSARQYVQQTLTRLSNRELHMRLRSHQEAGDRVLLASSSIDLVVAAIAEELEVEFLASRVGFRDGLCTGQIEDDLTGCKAKAVCAMLGDSLPEIHVYTDNLSDRDLVEISQSATIVIPRGRAETKWGKDGCAYIRL